MLGTTAESLPSSWVATRDVFSTEIAPETGEGAVTIVSVAPCYPGLLTHYSILCLMSHFRISQCPSVSRLTSRPRSAAQVRDDCTTCPPNPCMICQMTPQAGNDATDDYDYDDTEEDDTGDDSEEDNVNIDDGLLDDAFEESGVDVDVEPRGGGDQCNSCDMAVCVMGGGNAQVSLHLRYSLGA